MAFIETKLYASTRDEIKSLLEQVEGIGRVFAFKRLVTDWATWLQMFVADDGLFKICWFSPGVASEGDSGIGASDATGTSHIMQRDEEWTVEAFYGFKDDDFEPSEIQFQLLVDRVEDKFRFLQDLGGLVYESSALSRTYNGLWNFPGGVLCHRAEWKLKLTRSIVNPN